MKNIAHLAGMALNQPLFLEPAYAQVFFSGLGEKLNISELMNHEGELILPEGMEQLAGNYSANSRRDRSYRIENGVAVLPIDGTLVHKFGYLKPSSSMTGYDGILARAQQAMTDPDVKGILLDQDSPGGSVAGCFDTTSALQKLEKEGGKPIWSLCYDMTCSASMAIACGASRRLITSNGRAGSVGVIMAHSSHEKELKEKGIKVTLISSGAHKADGNPYQDIPQKVLENFQRDTDALRNEFAEIVANATSRKTSQVLGTEAQVYRGQEAIDIGFADDLVNGHEAVAYFGEFLSTQNKKSFQVGVSAMSQPEPAAEVAENKGPDEPAAKSVSAAQLEAARTDERARIKTITGSEEANGREGLATHFAHNTDMSAKDAVEALAASPKNTAEPAASTSALDQHMATEEQPSIGAESNNQAESKEDPVADMLNSFQAATGRDLGAK